MAKQLDDLCNRCFHERSQHHLGDFWGKVKHQCWAMPDKYSGGRCGCPAFVEDQPPPPPPAKE